VHTAEGLIRYLTAHNAEEVFCIPHCAQRRKPFYVAMILNILYKYFFPLLIVSQVHHVCFKKAS